MRPGPRPPRNPLGRPAVTRHDAGVRVLIVGCGYVGLPLGAELARRGHEVAGLRRTADGAEELRAAGVAPVVGDVTRLDTLRALPGPFDWVVNTVSSSKGGAEVYRSVYVEGTKNLIAWLADGPVRKFVHTSSTSVYGQTDGSEVTEDSPAEPKADTGRLLVETENLLRAAARERNFPAVVLRVAGIYGPGRGHLFQQYLRGEARISGDGTRLLNMIHRDDVVGAVIAALERGAPGRTYNVADNEPVTLLNFFQWLAGQLNRPLPPFATGEENAVRKRGVTNKRLSNRRLREELRCELRHPTFREGYLAEMRRLGLKH
ncbi:MAG: NAD-dependent epimerase/dehydratase [Limisphaerales bacterium]|nr:MAG: NAD-dependent epimerase/dehydratase [Limisphaerales bacterium]